MSDLWIMKGADPEDAYPDPIERVTCIKCGLDCTGHKAERSRLCDACLSEAKTNAQREWSNLMDARRESGRVQVNRTELREDGYHNEVTPAVETMQDQERYERGLI